MTDRDVDPDEVSNRVRFVAQIIDLTWEMAQVLFASKGQWSFEAEDLHDQIRSALCKRIEVPEEEVRRVEY